MNPKILVVVPFCKGDSDQAEKLCDWIYQLNGCQPEGHALLVASGDTHKEVVAKVQMAAEVSFLNVTVFEDKANSDIAPKIQRINRAIIGAADFVARHFNWPFLWLEPDAFPSKQEWLEQLAETYFSQPKKFMGPFMQYLDKDKKEHICTGRVAVYSPDAVNILRPFTATAVPFNIMGQEKLTAVSSKSQLFQEMVINSADDLIKMRTESVIVHSDKKGVFLTKMRDAAASETPEPPEDTRREADPNWKTNPRKPKLPYYKARAQLQTP